jgi:hypothetical protein
MSKGRAGITGAVWSPVPFEIYEDEWPVIIGYLEEARGGLQPLPMPVTDWGIGQGTYPCLG